MILPSVPAERAALLTRRLYASRRKRIGVIPTISRLKKSNSQSTVVWNPWTTQKMPEDFDQAEHRQMVCVESGNVKQNKLSLTPGKMAALKVVLASMPLR